MRHRARLKRPTQRELDALTADRRLELINQRRQSRHQALNSIGIMFGAMFTAASLVATAMTLHTTQQGQITDRYTKAVEQLGSPKRDVRLGAIYALERIAGDSARDRPTIIAVLAAFVREHDPAPDAKPPAETDTDVQAALAVLSRQPRDPRSLQRLDLHGIRTPHSQLPEARFRDTDLQDSDLKHANLTNADLAGADLSHTDLSDAILGGADLTGANLSNANLRNADLTYADLREADLTGVRGISVEELRDVAKTDPMTRF